jgi:hypothetical protein
MTKQTNSAIAPMNDELRKRVGMPCSGTHSTPGRIYVTAGVNALPPQKQVELWSLVRDFADFTPENDPHGERDFGGLDLEGAGKVFWKIDYYADETLTYGSEDPSDPARCFRVLTIMLVTEY